MPRVLQLIDHMGSGGAQTIVHDLARGLGEHDIDVEAAHLFAPNHFVEEFGELQIPIHDLSTGVGYSPLAALDPRPVRRLRQLLRRVQYDVVNAHLYIAPIHLRAALAGSGSRRPGVVNTVHAHEEHLPGYVYPSFRMTAGITNVFVADFHASRARLRAIAGSRGRVEVIPFGVAAVDRASGADRARFRAELGIPADGVVALSVARLHEQRCIDRFLDAAAEVPDVFLLLVGDGPREAELRSRAESLGIADRVRWAGRRSDLEVCCAASDVYLSMSVGGDVGIAALQAASSGLPVLAWDIAGLAIGADDFDEMHPALTASGELFEAQLRQLVADRGFRDRAAAHACRIARSTFDVAAMVRSYADLYRSVE